MPSLPSVGLEVLALTRKPDVNAEQIARLVETDPGLSAKVLKTVNSSLYGLKDPCTTIRRAIGYLGLTAVKSLVLSFSLMDAGKSVVPSTGPSVEDFWRRAIYAAAAARAIAIESKACDPDEAFTAALFQDLGVLTMLATIRQDFESALAPDPFNHPRHCELESAALGFTHTYVGGVLAERWRLPPAYAHAIKFHHTPDECPEEFRNLVRVAGLGGTFASALTTPTGAAHLPLLLTNAKGWLSLSAAQVKLLMGKIAPAARELARMFDKPLGKLPNLQDVMAQANEELAITQMQALREAEDLRVRNQALQVQAETDALTKLANRKKFDAESARMFDQARAASRPLSLIMVDGDRFKSVNDTHGHAAGDAVLRELASRIRAGAGDAGLACRFGGEEFAILLPRLGLSHACELAERVRGLIASTPISLAGVDGAPPALAVTASFGVACFDPSTGACFESVTQILEAADRALYKAKHNGRNRVESERPPQTAHPKPPAPAGAAPAAKDPILIVLIEDDALAAKLLITLIRKTPGVEVEWLRDGAAAVRRIEQYGASGRLPGVFLTDIQLPGIDGVGVIRAVRAQQRLAKVPIVAMSATTDAAQHAACKAAGSTTFVNKLDLAADLNGWISKIIAGNSAGRAQAAA